MDADGLFGKIPTVFARDFKGRFGPPSKYVTDRVGPETQWVLDGFGQPTRKLDGTCCYISPDRVFYKRHDAEAVRANGTPYRGTLPNGFALVRRDPVTGRAWGWVPVKFGNPDDRLHIQALLNCSNLPPNAGEEAVMGMERCALGHGTYELLGPRVRGNMEKDVLPDPCRHHLMRHGCIPIDDDAICATDELGRRDGKRSYDTIEQFLRKNPYIEGIVWHWTQPDGTVHMAKIKGVDFGVARRVR